MNANKNILFLASWYPNTNLPALGNFIKRHAEAVSLFAKVTVLAAFPDEKLTTPKVEVNESSAIKEVVVYYPKVKSKVPLIKELLAYKSYMSAMTLGFEKIKNTHFEIGHVHVAFPAGLFALELKRKKNIPYLLSEHWTGYLPIKNQYPKFTRLKKWQYRKIFSESKKLTVVSQDLGESIKNLNLKNEFEVIPNVVNQEIFNPKAEERNEGLTFLHVSTFDDKHKNITGMLNAFERLSNEGIHFKLKLICELGKKTVEDFIKKYNFSANQIEVFGLLPPEKVANQLNQANFFVLFSNYETFSIVLAEAWSCGIPAIYSKCGGLTNIEDKELGIQVEKGNENALFQALIKANQNKENYERSLISQKVACYSPKEIGNSFIKNYDNC